MSGAGFGDFGSHLFGIKVHTSPYAYTYEPVKKHKHRSNQRASYHRRIQKKWTKRFGTKKVPCAFFFNGAALGLGPNGIVISPETAKQIALLKDFQS